MIKAITIDFWGTLVLDSPAADERYRLQRLVRIEGSLKAAGVTVSKTDLQRGYDESGRYLARLWQNRRDVSVTQHVTALLEAVDPTLPRRLTPEIMAGLIDAYASPPLMVPPALDPGAKAALRELAARGLILCIVSNTMRTPGQVLRAILDHHGLLNRFAVLTFSDECGIRKPDPQIFHLTLHQIGVQPREAVHVGDDPLLDVEGARSARMRVIQVDGDRSGPARVKPDAVIRGLGQLPAALESLNR